MGFYLISSAQVARLTLHLKQVSLGQVFELIQRQSEYILFFKDNQVNLEQKVTIDADNLSIEEILDQILAGTKLNYKIFDRQIILVKDFAMQNNLNTTFATDAFKKKRVSGRVTDESGNPISGVSVIVKGTSIGMITNSEGAYNLEVPESSMDLIFSYVGFKKAEELLLDKTEINVVLVSDNFGVDEVVISALGLKRAEKSITYSTQSIDASEISKTQGFSFVNCLSGKIAGIEINRSAAGAGGSTKVMLRGNKSLSTSSDPLFVIDGIPMANNKGEQLWMWGGSDGGDGLSQLNPEDIESISILKGANAAALYGSQGANGVILVTTKKGDGMGTKISLSSSVLFETIQKTPDLQFDYGSVDGAKESWSATKGNYSHDFVDDFFQTGSNKVNTLSISSGGKQSVAYFSFSNTSIDGIVPRNQYRKNNVTFKQSTKLFDDYLTVSSTIMLSDEATKNRNTAGYYLNPLVGLYLFPRDRDYATYARNYQISDISQGMYPQYWFVNDHFQSNPNWIIYNEPKEDITQRMIANATVEYDITKNLSFKVRGNYDFASRSHEQKNKAGSNRTNVHPNGSWVYRKYTDELIYGDAILTYSNRFDSQISLNAILGSSFQKSTYGLGYNINTGLDGLKIPNEFNFLNKGDNVLVNSDLLSRLIKEAVFGNIQLGFKEMLFFEFTGRNDWASSLYGTASDSYFYPSAGLSGIVSEMVKLPEFISYGKIRASYSMVSNEVPFNSVSPGNSITSSGISINTTKSFQDLKPEMIRSLEFGADWRFFKGRLGIDFTYYNTNSRNQFIALPAPSGSGYTQYFVSAGEIINSGVEVSLNAEPFRTKNFHWSAQLNYSHNHNRIVSLHPDLKNPISLSDDEGYQLTIKEGGSFGDLYVYKFLRDGMGRIKLDEKGNILKTTGAEYIGNSNPDWGLGWNNNFTYKRFSLSFLINSKIGGKVISQTEAILDGYGVSKRTADARDNGGVTINAIKPDGTVVTTIDARKYYSTIGDRNGIKEPYTYDRTNIRLAQLLLSYNLDLQWSTVKQISLSLVGQNLFFIYKVAPFDPEITLNTGLSYQALDNFSIPETRTIGAILKFSF